MALQDVLIDELRDMYSAENQLVKALPKLAKGAKHPELKQLFKDHLEETKGQVLRLRQVFEQLGKKPTGKHCSGMEGVISEGSEQLEEDLDDASFDSGLIGAALRTEHYEIAGYQACIAIAKTLGQREIVELLKENLQEEVEAAKKVQAASKAIFKEAMEEEEEDKDSVPASKKPAREKTAERKSQQDEKAAAGDVGKSKKGTAPKKQVTVDEEDLEAEVDETDEPDDE
ncbi:MAG TPA: ferritin-like domain-containing protein [Acidobacteriaceae bacterium]|jgi:ferritin-like metal-binding protein YciE|nr:ferritin-like domain-containing protein [Acidobacteriaceae bacterium]